MAHDGQDMNLNEQVLISDLLTLTGQSIAPIEKLLEQAKENVRSQISKDGRVSAGLIEVHQQAAHGLAWLATYVESLRQMDNWAQNLQSDGRFGEIEQIILQIAFGEYLAQIQGGIAMNQGEILRLTELGRSPMDRCFQGPAIVTLIAAGNSQAARSRLVGLMQEQSANVTVGHSGLDEELEMIRDQFRRFAVEKVEPFAHDWHLKDELIPMEMIEELAELGVFGLTIPEELGGFGLSKASMAVVS